MELQLLLDPNSECLPGGLWPSSPTYHQLSPRQPGEFNGNGGVLGQQEQNGFLSLPQNGASFWQEDEFSSKSSPDASRSPVYNCNSADNAVNTANANSDNSSRSSNTSNGSNQSPAQKLQSTFKRRADNFYAQQEPDKKIVRRIGNFANNCNQEWPNQVDMLAEHLGAEFDGSLSALAANDLATAVASYNMSEALLSLPPLPVFKQEAPSPDNHQNNIQLNRQNLNQNNSIISGSNNGSMEADSNTKIQNVQNLHQLYSPNEDYQANPGSYVSSSQQGVESPENCRYQYILAASTSIATKSNEETLTYLNQGQSYEIKLKKLGDPNSFRGKALKSTIRIRFHERRLQYMEREQILSWLQARPGERLLEVDVPLSYGMTDVRLPSPYNNSVEFMWDPSKDVGVYVKINCISTEFTPKKHGGEKGVPFRIEVETSHVDGQRLHIGSCQVKVFKLKGADRKHKQDRDKLQKRPNHEREKYQPSYEYTILNDIALEAMSPPSPYNLAVVGSPYPLAVAKTPEAPLDGKCSPVGGITSASRNPSPINVLPETPTADIKKQITNNELNIDSSPAETIAWLQARGFQAFESAFSSFSSSDILRLSRNDVIQICGTPEGIRLYNALHARAPPPRLSLFFTNGNCQNIWTPVYLESLTSQALTQKILTALGLPTDRIYFLTLLGPQGIHVRVTDDAVANIKDNSMFIVESIREQGSDRYKLLLKPSSN